ncbi:MurR/RpiR family transcriptional regulator [Caproicibacter sp.]|uniref:MurR/RpiR family transcriptional regulator n=1 Tax=Caproicibacter sp. TaxID=2814884 RepID=UPI0039894423
MDLYQNIEKYYSDLTSKQKEIADYMLSNPEDICYITLKNLSEHLSVSELTILRMCKKLGFQNYVELKNAFRVHTQKLVKNSSSSNFFVLDMPVCKENEKEGLLHQIRDNDCEKSLSFYHTINDKDIFAAADRILKARNIFICFHGVSKILADNFYLHLSHLSIGCSYIHPEDMDNVQANLIRMKRGDLLIAIAFPKYYTLIQSITKYAEQSGADIITITDSPTSPIITKRSLNFFCNTSTKLFYNSLSLPVALINLIASCIVIEMGEKYDDLVTRAYNVVNFLEENKSE